jgi:hypothetical protein
MSPSLLVLCYPTYSRALHLDSKNLHVVLAPDEIPAHFLRLGHRVEIINLSPFDTDKPLMRSNVLMKRLHQVDPTTFDLCWHMFRDPLEEEVKPFLPSFSELLPANRTINHASRLQNHFKRVYLPILHQHGIGPQTFPEMDHNAMTWGTTEWSVAVSTCGKFIRVYDYNNNRGDYPEREKRSQLVVEYLDAATDGQRSFFRCGYAAGRVLPGTLYTSGADKVVQKSGICKIKWTHHVPEQFHGAIVASFNEMGIDACHFEGLYVNGNLRVFDVNPYPTSYGSTLRPMSEAMTEAIIARWNESQSVRP